MRFHRIVIALFAIQAASAQQPANQCDPTTSVTANVAALDQPYMYNRLGAAEPQGMIFALERDLVPMNYTGGAVSPGDLHAGNVRLRDDKRPRPLVLRINRGACLQVNFRNLLDANPSGPPQLANSSTAVTDTRYASLHVSGLNLVASIVSDASFVGTNPSGILAPEPNGPPVYLSYTWFAQEEGTFFVYSSADEPNNVGGQQNVQVAAGMFGAVNVEPAPAEYYRSQVTRDQLDQATLSANALPLNMYLTPVKAKGVPKRVSVRASMFYRDVPANQLTRDLNILTTIDERQQTVHTARVVIDPGPEKRIFAIDEESDKTTGHPVMNYAARYPPGAPNGLACAPVLRMAAAPMAVSQGKCAPITVVSATATNPLVITTSAAHSLIAGARVAITGATGGWAKANGAYPVTVISATQFSLPVDATSFTGNFDGVLNLPQQLYYSDLTAIITGPGADSFPLTDNSPTFNQNPAEPDRREPYREITIHYHNPQTVVQAFQEFSNPNLQSAYGAVQDQFGINYGIAGIGAEILANRLGVGPMGNKDAVDLKFEEFFLSSWAVGDPAMVVDTPANAPNAVFAPPTGGIGAVNNTKLNNELKDTYAPLSHARATKVFYPDDPSNVYHSYLRDHVKMRILHAGPPAAHVHHLHAHQWLRTPDSDEGHYLDSQMLTPGAAFTLEIAYGGSGNRNLTVGDSIFHCHFYPHFAAGMWGLWRVHDVFESGTKLVNGIPEAGINRVLPDGEIAAGTPIPAIVPLPTLAMAPIPADVRLTDAYTSTNPSQHDGRRIEVIPESKPGAPLAYRNPGYPFFVPGVAGHRPPHPPLDFAYKVDDAGEPVLKDGNKQPLDGGLPRHVVLDGTIFRESHTRWDFTKDFVLYGPDHKTLIDGLLTAYELPEAGTAVERAAMAYHSTRTHKSFLPNGDPGNFVTNGTPPVSGAPFAGPGVTDTGNTNINTRRYKGADIQMDVVFNKKGWHYPQQRMITLWQDVKPTVNGERPPQPFFMRAATGETVEYWQTNLVPNYYELDDFQVRTPTDIIGQHIHLVKFDVLASDGAANGFNYEDGTFSPDEVRERIFAVNKKCSAPGKCGLFAFDDGPRQFINYGVQNKKTVTPYKEAYGVNMFGDPPPHQDWDGAQTTIQLWDTDPLLNNAGHDRTLRTVFTHDHFGPSTHQQVGLYGGLLVEPESSLWSNPITGERLYDTRCYDANGKPSDIPYLTCPAGLSRRRSDGGPTSWEAIVRTANVADSYREFALEFQDMALAYTRDSSFTPSVPTVALFAATGSLPSPGPVPPALQQQFNANGLPLTSKATVIPVAAGGAPCANFTGTTLFVHDPTPPDQNQDYCLGAGSANVNVFTASANPGWAQPDFALLPPNGGNLSPTVVSAGQSGTETVNYRNEPVPSRICGPTCAPPPSTQPASDLSYVFTSIKRADPDLDCQPVLGTLIAHPCQPLSAAETAALALCQKNHDYCPFRFPLHALVPQEVAGGAQNYDPFTPLLRAYQNDRVQIRTFVGAHLTLHSFELQGINWLMQPTYENSGYRAMQGMGLSEHYEMLFKLPRTQTAANPFADYLLQPNAGVDGVVNGMWGILRSFDMAKAKYDTLKTLPNNETPAGPPQDVCASAANRNHPVTFNVKAITANLTYYNRQAAGTTVNIADQAAMVYVNADTYNGGPVTEPLILRAHAGDCIQVNLTNALPAVWPGPLPVINGTPPGTFSTNIIQSSVFGQSPPLASLNLPVSMNIGLHPQLLSFDVTQGNGANVGYNAPVTVAPGASSTTPLRWFAGKPDGTPVEFGTVLLEPSDPLLQHFTGLYGILIVEPAGSTWTTDPGTSAMATVIKPDMTTYRELVLGFQSDIENQNVPNVQAGFNYTTEPVGVRLSQAATTSVSTAVSAAPASEVAKLRAQALPVDQFSLRKLDQAEHTPAPEHNYMASRLATSVPAITARFSNTLFPAGTTPLNPQTPILPAAAGDPVRIHLAYAGGTPVFNNVFEVNGHAWEENPWIHGSTQLGHNELAQHFGMEQVVPFQAGNFLLPHAGGHDRIPGDYLYDMFEGESNNAPGSWGFLRVRDLRVTISSASATGAIQGTLLIAQSAASSQPLPGPTVVTVVGPAGPVCSTSPLTIAPGAATNWSCKGSSALPAGANIVAVTSAGGQAQAVVAPVTTSRGISVPGDPR